MSDSAYIQLSKLTDGHDINVTLTLRLSTYAALLDAARREYSEDGWRRLVALVEEAIP